MPVTASLSSKVAELLQHAADELVLPRFRKLESGDIEEKAPGDLVTVVDRETELLITPQLLALLPGSRVVGEEAAATQPELLRHLDKGWVWLLDPLDGTSNFAAGHEQFAMMAALLREGEPVGSWILSPRTGELAVAEKGAGAFINGSSIRVSSESSSRSSAGVLKAGFLPEQVMAGMDVALRQSDAVSEGAGSAGREYAEFVQGNWRFLFYWRTLAWDHAPGSLLVTEAGGHVGRLDDTPYRAWDSRCSLLVTPDQESWQVIRRLFPDQVSC